MNVRVVLNLEELKKRLCPDCQKVVDAYLKELAVEALKRDIEPNISDKGE